MRHVSLYVALGISTSNKYETCLMSKNIWWNRSSNFNAWTAGLLPKSNIMNPLFRNTELKADFIIKSVTATT